MKKIEMDTTSGQDRLKLAYAPHTPFKQPKKRVMQLPQRYSFDLDRVLRESKKIIEEHGLRPFMKDAEGKKKSRSYKGICFTTTRDSHDPLYEGLKFSNSEGMIENSQIFGRLEDRSSLYPPVDETGFLKPTSILTETFQDIFSKFQSPITKARLVELNAGGVILPHVDYPYYEQIKLHAAIETNENSFWIVEGERFHIPADGNFYWIDSGRLHAAENYGKQKRLHLNINLRVYFDLDGKALHPSSSSLEDLIENEMI